MPKRTLHSIIPLYTLLGILSVKKNENDFKNSRFRAVLNVLMMPMVFIYTIILLSNQKLQNEILRAGYKKFSSNHPFVGFVMLAVAQSSQWTSFFICVFQFLRQNKILKFLNRVNEVSMDEKYCIQLKKRCTSSFIFMSCVFVVNFSIQFMTRSKLTILSVASFTFLMFSYLVVPAFLSFMKTIEIFFLMCLKDIKDHLKNSISINSFDSESVSELITKYQEIFEMNKIFNDIFGMQVTLVTCCIASMTTCQVKQNHLFKFEYLL